MTGIVFELLTQLDAMLWDYIGLIIILLIGFYLTIYSKFFQFRALFRLRTYVKDLIACAGKDKQGTNPIKLYFASVGGMVGLGNIVTVEVRSRLVGLEALYGFGLLHFLGC